MKYQGRYFDRHWFLTEQKVKKYKQFCLYFVCGAFLFDPMTPQIMLACGNILIENAEMPLARQIIIEGTLVEQRKEKSSESS